MNYSWKSARIHIYDQSISNALWSCTKAKLQKTVLSCGLTVWDKWRLYKKNAWHNILYIDDLYLTGHRLYLKQTLQVIVLMFLEGNLKCMWPKLKIHPHNLHITMSQKKKKKTITERCQMIFFYCTKVVKIQGIDVEMLGLFWQVEARAQ